MNENQNPQVDPNMNQQPVQLDLTQQPVASDATPVTPEVNPAPVAPTQEVTEQPVVEQPQFNQPMGQGIQPVPEPTKKNNSNIVFIIIVVLLVAIIAVIGVVLVLRNVKNDKKADNTTTVTTVESTGNETYTTKSTTTTNTQINSTTTRTYTTKQNYTQTTRTTKAPDTPEPVKKDSSTIEFDNYTFNVPQGMEVFEDGSNQGLYDSLNNMEIYINIYENASVEVQLNSIDSYIEYYQGLGYQVIDVNAGSIAGINALFISFTDGQYYYYEVMEDTLYGDMVEALVMSTQQYTGISVCQRIFELTSTGTKTGTASTAAPAGNGDKFGIFDERLLKQN